MTHWELEERQGSNCCVTTWLAEWSKTKKKTEQQKEKKTEGARVWAAEKELEGSPVIVTRKSKRISDRRRRWWWQDKITDKLRLSQVCMWRVMNFRWTHDDESKAQQVHKSNRVQRTSTDRCKYTLKSLYSYTSLEDLQWCTLLIFLLRPSKRS